MRLAVPSMSSKTPLRSPPSAPPAAPAAFAPATAMSPASLFECLAAWAADRRGGVVQVDAADAVVGHQPVLTPVLADQKLAGVARECDVVAGLGLVARK